MFMSLSILPATDGARRYLHLRSHVAVCALTLWLCACERPDQQSQPSPSAAAPDARESMRWQRINDSAVIAVNDPDVAARLVEATTEARRTLDDARQRWGVAKPQERALWAVKWAAPLANDASADASTDPLPADASQESNNHDGDDGGGGDQRNLEHVWVQPINWSPFRIEGVLLSPPVHTLDCNRRAGELVSFPADQVVDWLHFAADPTTNPSAPFEGGFTVKVLEHAYGRP